MASDSAHWVAEHRRRQRESGLRKIECWVAQDVADTLDTVASRTGCSRMAVMRGIVESAVRDNRLAALISRAVKASSQ